MRLTSAVLGFLLRKLGLLLALMLTLFLGYLLMQVALPTFQNAVSERDRLEKVIAEQEKITADLEDLHAAEIKKRERVCDLWHEIIAKPMPGNVCKDAQAAVDGVEAQLAAAEQKLADAKQQEQELRESRESGVGWVVDQAAKSWKKLLGIALLVVFAIPVWRSFSYFVLMPLIVKAHRPIHLAARSQRRDARLVHSAAERTMPIHLAPGEVLSARSEYVRPVQGATRGRLLYNGRAPFISFAAGLYGLTRVVGDEAGTVATLAPEDPNQYLMRVDLHDHPGVVVHPRQLVGVIGTPDLSTAWRWGIQAFATWQVRYIMFGGTGTVLLQGLGDIAVVNPGERPSKMDQHLVMGFDSQLTVGIARTEVFWPYLFGTTPLVDDTFSGPHPMFWQKSSTGASKNPVAKTLDAIFSSLGKLLGF